MGFFFHYSALNSFLQAVDGSRYTDHKTGKGQTGLIPGKRVLRLGLASQFNLPAKAEKGAIFGLLEPQPVSWMQHEYHKGQGLLETILRDMQVRDDRMVLLKCKTVPRDDIYVADHVFHMREDYKGGRDLENPVTAEVKRDYWRSMVPFNDYKGGYAVPEVISFSPIPLSRITVVRKYEATRDLVNELREKAGKPLLPPDPKPDPAYLATFLESMYRRNP